ncbi:AvrD family protein [Streptomyces sp. NPDC090022]|uniref:AvrD family protein n=1 Tax=Streptomyces sp. NPDC090022 TaxID=3365920 RepID=UPI00382D0595
MSVTISNVSNVSNVSNPTLSLSSIDDYLGPGEGRFFSRGYQRAGYLVRDIVATPVAAERPGIHATVDVSYPADWSRKKDGTDLRPHLSTVDALVLGVQLAELHLVHAYGLTGDAHSTMRLRKIVLRAGGAPQEDLLRIPAASRLVRTEEVPGAPGRVLSVHDGSVGALRVRCEIEHDEGVRADTEGLFAGLDEGLGDGRLRFYGEGFKKRRHVIRDVAVDMESLSAEADVHFHPGPTDVPVGPDGPDGPGARGVDAAVGPAVSMVDAFVVNLQLVQVLMYELDQVNRANSNTLWMMQTVLTAADTALPLPTVPAGAARARARLLAKRLLPLRGGVWRSVEIEAGLGGVGLRCSFAHELPPEAASAAT